MATNSKDPGSSSLRTRQDRCANPLNIASHIGKRLRKPSKRILGKFPNLPPNSRICRTCATTCDGDDMSKSLDSTISEESIDSYAGFKSSPIKRKCLSREDELEELLNGLKEKFSSLSEKDPLRLTILTIAPDCWPIRKICSEFGTSTRMAQKAKNLKKSEGVLATPSPKSGKNLPKSTIGKVINFYEEDINSRIMPNKKDTVTVRVDCEKKKVQKRLLLSDIKQLHKQFKEQNPEIPIGLSKFAELRPKWCVVAGASGTHSVCVCTIHENFNAMIDAVNLEYLTIDSQNPMKDRGDCISFVTCCNSKPACYFNECDLCPGIEKFSDFMNEVFQKQRVSQVIYSVWQSTDRCTLKQECLSAENFVDELCVGLQKLLPHHFIAKNQSEYVMERKNNLKEDEVLVQFDFSENFKYVVQNAAQAFHYNNDQCTVHPAVFYYRSGEELKHSSLVLLSDCTTHDTAAVYIMQTTLIPVIKEVHPKVKKIIYVTDGAKQHYKNRFQMMNLMHHEEDFDLKGEWHFQATAHGKGACDGIGATLKREATRACLQAKSTKEAILTSQDLYEWAKIKFENMRIIHYNKESHNKTQRKLNKRFSLAPNVTKIQSGHSFIPIRDRKLEVRQFSGADNHLSIIQY